MPKPNCTEAADVGAIEFDQLGRRAVEGRLDGGSMPSDGGETLPSKLKPGMLVLADRNFYGFKLWRLACASGAKLAWRVKAGLKLPVERVLPDGSYVATVFDSSDRHRSAGQVVPVID